VLYVLTSDTPSYSSTALRIQTLFDSWFISLYNVIFTGVPIIGLAIFDQDVDQDLVLKYPKLYLDGQRGTEVCVLCVLCALCVRARGVLLLTVHM